MFLENMDMENLLLDLDPWMMQDLGTCHHPGTWDQTWDLNPLILGIWEPLEPRELWVKPPLICHLPGTWVQIWDLDPSKQFVFLENKYVQNSKL